ncbi:hypothetical protein HELRODRAFT_163986 [Helobdella robusta]|uniref:Small monomeric GTPase n=1 Tax=Helobdella robusta TaxID=6412 RepID=T1EUQ3_HELRO|nr:hypothetical protein HELRODRAFT_163986 [Helobdella robusta]ESN94196.1 hypothetical protein HELRODRAFT_163986 [Helobdella robusta]
MFMMQPTLGIRMEVERFQNSQEVGAYIVMYSITDILSYHVACNMARQLCNVDESSDKVNKKIMKRNYAVIMVGNKEDLVRNRKVLESDSRETCNALGCKFIEVSAGLNHKLDELLVGIVYQVRLNAKRKLLMSKQNKVTSQKLTSSLPSSLTSSKPSSNSSYFGWFKKVFGLKNKNSEYHCEDMKTF